MSAPSPSVPLAPADLSAAGPSLVATEGLRRILLVDDEAHVLRVLRLSLDRNGYEIDTALKRRWWHCGFWRSATTRR